MKIYIICFLPKKLKTIERRKNDSIILTDLMQARSWEYCNNIRKHYYTEKLGWSEPNLT